MFEENPIVKEIVNAYLKGEGKLKVERAKTKIERFYNPPREDYINEAVETQLSKLKGASPIGKWVKYVVEDQEIYGYVTDIVNYGTVKVKFIDEQIAGSKELVMKFHVETFVFDEDYDVKDYFDTISDLCLATRNFEYLNELVEKCDKGVEKHDTYK